MEEAKFELWDSHPPVKENEVFISSTIPEKRLEISVEKIIDEIWAKKQGQDNPILNLVFYRSLNDGFTLMNVNRSSFRYHWCLNKINEIPNSKKIAIENDLLVLTGVALTLTSDKKIIVGKRTKGGVTKGSYTLLPGGYMHPDKDLTAAHPNIFQTIRREFEEEIGMNPFDLEITKTGLVYSDFINRGFTLPFLIQTPRTFTEIEQAYLKKHDSETEAIIPLELSKKSIDKFLGEHFDEFSNNGLGTLLLSGKHLKVLGKDWYEGLLNEIKKSYGPVNVLQPKYSDTSFFIRDVLKNRTY